MERKRDKERERERVKEARRKAAELLEQEFQGTMTIRVVEP